MLTHITSSGEDHTYIDQDYRTTAAPSWAGGTFANTLKAAAGTYSGNLDIAGDVTIDASLTANSLSVLGSASSGGAVGTFKGFEDGAGILVGPQTGEYTTETVMKYYHSGEGSDSFDWIYTYEDHGYLTLENSTGTTSLLLSDNSFHLKSGTSNSQSRIEGDLNNLELICPPSGTIKLTGNADVDGNINIGGTYSASATPGISGTFCSSTGTISFKNGIVVQFTS